MSMWNSSQDSKFIKHPRIEQFSKQKSHYTTFTFILSFSVLSWLFGVDMVSIIKKLHAFSMYITNLFSLKSGQ